ncbi:WD40-repeat-containing domain protein [Trichoderma sp. SZMC 28015]
MATTKPRSNDDYMIGWICTLPREWMEALPRLDETHPSIEKPSNDTNNYIMGSIYRHNIVIAYPPNKEIGNDSAAAMVAARMKSTFPQMRFVLLVGIGSGIPSKASVGDVVVSTSVEGEPGLVQWGMEKVEGNDSFKRIGSLKPPPASLLTALTKLQKGYELSRAKKSKHFEALLKKRLRLTSKSSLWNSLKVKLGKADHGNVNNSTTGDEDDGGEEENRRNLVHFGMIASGDQVIKDANLRIKLNEDLGGKVLCVEVGAAGLAKLFPCLVIRGICDYVDLINADRQRDAVANAADFAKNLLEYVKPKDVKREPLAKDMADKVFDSSTGNDSSLDVAVDADRKLQRLALTLALAQMLRNKQQNDKTQQLLSQKIIQLRAIRKRQEKLDFELRQSEIWKSFLAKVTRKQRRLSKRCISTQTRLLKLRQLDGLDHDCKPEDIDTSRLFRWAVEDGDAEIVELLLNGGTDATVAHQGGWMPLHAAASKGYVDVIRLLLGRGRVDADSKNGDGRTALQLAIERGHGDVVRPLLRKCANKDAAITPVQWLLEGYGHVKFVAFSHDSRLLAAATEDGHIRLWNMATGHCQEKLEGPSLGTSYSDRRSFTSMDFSHNSKLLASGSNDGAIKIWNTTTGKCTQTLPGHKRVNLVAFSHDSNLLASAVGAMIEIWDLATGSCQKTLEGHEDRINAVTFSNDSKLLASGSNDFTVKLWNTTTGECQQTLEGHKSGVCSVAFSHDSKILASGSYDAVKIWDTTTGKCQQTIQDHENWVCSLAISRDSKLLASGSEYKIKLYNMTTGQCQETFRGYSQCALPWAFPNGTKLAAARIQRDDTIKVWVVPIDILRVNMDET